MDALLAKQFVKDKFKATPTGFVQKGGTYVQIKDNKVARPEPWLHAQIISKKRTKGTHGFGSVTEFTCIIYVWDTRKVLSILQFSVADATPELFSNCTKAKDNHKPLVYEKVQ